VKNHIASRHRPFDGSSIPEVSGNAISPQAVDISNITAGPHQQSQIRALLSQNARNVAADESGGACDEG
jgi:hypothetical protein